MIKEIGAYLYNHSMTDVIDVFTLIDNNYKCWAVFTRSGNRIFSESTFDNVDYNEMRDNAILIFTGQITME